MGLIAAVAVDLQALLYQVLKKSNTSPNLVMITTAHPSIKTRRSQAVVPINGNGNKGQVRVVQVAPTITGIRAIRMYQNHFK